MFLAVLHEGQHETRARGNTKGVVRTGKPVVPPLDKQALTCNRIFAISKIMVKSFSKKKKKECWYWLWNVQNITRLDKKN